MLNETQVETSTESQATTASTAKEVDPRDVPIEVLPDQDDVWFDTKRADEEEPGACSGKLDEAIARILAAHDADGVRTDRKVDDLNHWVFLVNGFGCIARRGEKFTRTHDAPSGSDELLYLRHTAFGHLCDRSKAPSKYLRSIPSRYTVPALNWGITNKSEGPALIRLAGADEIRAIVSRRYAAFDDCVILPQLKTSLDAAGLLDSVNARVIATGMTTLMRIGIEGDAIAIPGTDEIAEVAIDMTNGEVGNRAVALASSVYLRTRSLSVRRTGLRLRHLGTSDKIADAFREAIPQVLADSRKLRDQIAKAVDRAISDVVAEADKLRLLGLSLSDARDVLRTLATDAGVPLPQDTADWEEPLKGVVNVRAFDVFMAVAALGETKGVDRRLELEEAASRYLARISK